MTNKQKAEYLLRKLGYVPDPLNPGFWRKEATTLVACTADFALDKRAYVSLWRDCGDSFSRAGFKIIFSWTTFQDLKAFITRVTKHEKRREKESQNPR